MLKPIHHFIEHGKILMLDEMFDDLRRPYQICVFYKTVIIKTKIVSIYVVFCCGMYVLYVLCTFQGVTYLSFVAIKNFKIPKNHRM